MRVELGQPLKEAGKVRVTYNDRELFVKEYAAGAKVRLQFETPKESGHAVAVLLIGGKEVPLGSASYFFNDPKGASMRLEVAKQLAKKQQHWRARTHLLVAITLFEQIDCKCDELAEAYRQLAFVYWSVCSRKMRCKRRKEALDSYEKALAVWERNGNHQELSANLTNISAMYTSVGDKETALARALRGLQLEKEHPQPQSDERVAAWTHAGGCHLALGQLDEAEAVIADGFASLGDDPSSGYLWSLKALVFEARAKQCRERAEELLPEDHCRI